LVKDASEQDTMRRAATISAAAHVRAMQTSARMLRAGEDAREYHLEAELLHEFRRHGAQFPANTSIVADGDDYLLNGDLTIKGVTKPVTFELEFDGVATDPWGNTKAGFSAEAEINRKDWGLEWNVALETGGVLVSEKIKIELDIQAVKA
jgi:polyisoprenoid-binding protein YceI